MQNLGIQSRVVLLGALPAVLFSIVLAGYAIATVFTTLEDSHYERGHMIAAQLAPAAENDLILEDVQRLQALMQQLLSIEQELRAVVITDTHGDVLASSGQSIKLIAILRKLGCKFALDDFGSGMSSFMYLKNFAVDYLKIDGSFVKEIHLNTIDYATVQSIHSVAQALNIKTVAEYVENDAILQELVSIGVAYGQGNRLGEPIELKHLIENLSKVES